VVAEVYPSLLKIKAQPGEVKDLVQVRETAEHFAKLDEAGKLAELFAAPKGLDEAALAEAEREEGWVLGA
ncbi:MAG: cobalamin biosynthesis protein CbiG, partial [Phenylobacterium sp.]|nr:cobalamin biosynthesis protein CbiG [Phenylobacterium sp.]